MRELDPQKELEAMRAWLKQMVKHEKRNIREAKARHSAYAHSLLAMGIAGLPDRAEQPPESPST